MVQCQALGQMKIGLVIGLVLGPLKIGLVLGPVMIHQSLILVLANLNLIPALKNGKTCYDGTKLIHDTTMCDVHSCLQ